MRLSIRFVVLLLFSFSSVAHAAAPKVVKATPDNNAKDVDPATKEIRVTFDQPMDHGGFSWVGGGENFPKITGKGKWIDAKTCVLPVKLEPEHDYALSINNQTFQNFCNKAGEPAVPYPISFTTAADAHAAKLTPAQNR